MLLFVVSTAHGCADASLEPPSADSSGQPPDRGAVVTSVFPTGPGDIYGLRPHDLLVGWQQGNHRGTIESPFDALVVEAERGPRGDLVLELYRDHQTIRVAVPSGGWEVEFGVDHTANHSLGAEPYPHRPIDCWNRLEAARAILSDNQLELADQRFRRLHSECAEGDTDFRAVMHELEGRAWKRAGRSERAQRAFRDALTLRRAQPDSPALAGTLVNVAEVSDFGERFPLLQEARQILERTGAETADLAMVINQLGIVAWEVDRSIDRSRALYSTALDIRQRTIPGSYRIAQSLNNLASSAIEEGRLDEAERFIASALELLPNIPGLKRWRAYALNTLGRVQRDKGSYRHARMSWEAALEIFTELDPRGVATAGVTNNLGNLSLRVGDLDRAKKRYLESLALRRARRDNRLRIAESLNNLGGIALARGHLDNAQRYLEEALVIKQADDPESLSHANTLHWIAELSHRKGNFEDAEAALRKSLDIRQQISPHSSRVAESHISLARLLVDQGRTADGIVSWKSGLDLLEETRQTFRFSAQERSVLASRFQDHYRELAGVLVEQQRPHEAFELLERSRGRALRMMWTRHRATSSITSSLHESSPVRLDEIRASLDPTTRLIIFSVEPSATMIAIISPVSDEGPSPGLMFERVDIDRPELERRVDLFRALIARGRTQPTIEAALLGQASKLFDLLVEPIREHIAPAQRLVIIPDRPLNTLPFAALLESNQPPRFMADWKPLSYAISASVFVDAKRRRQRHAASDPRIAIFASTTNQSSQALSGVRAEAAALHDLFGERTLATDATEASFIDMFSPSDGLEPPTYLHLAAHAATNSRAPLDSVVHLTDGAGEDGHLHAWEVIERVRVACDLVVLSACETGLGRDLGGEGVLGLSHAFMFAGARTVLSSLWKVPDDSTADWMIAFYRALDNGFDRDHAIVSAQRIIREQRPNMAHPYHWAGFQLWSDWG